ncbi:MAG: GntG family PLP-dependent aldolase [Lautropia sp.]
MIDFRSDTVTRPTAAMRDAMLRAPLGDDVFGDDPTVNRLQEHAATLLGFDAALFAPSGTQTNLIALMSQCQRGDEAIVGQLWHSYRWEGGGMAVLGSIQPQPIENQPDGTLRVADIAAAIKPDDPHFARTRLIALENTTGGKVLPIDYLNEVGALARSRGLVLHLDGARLFNAAVAIAAGPVADGATAGGTVASRAAAGGAAVPGVAPHAPTHAEVVAAARAICAPFDTVSLCLSKGLGAPIGSLILGPADTIARARRIRKMLGGGMRQAGVIAAAGMHALEHHLARLADDHRNARRLADGLRALAAADGPLHGRLAVVAPDTNIVFVDVAGEIASAFARHLAAHGIGVTGGLYGSGVRQRWVTHLDVDAEAVEQALEAVGRFTPSAAAVA